MLDVLLRAALRRHEDTAAAGAVRDDPPAFETATAPAVAVTTEPAPEPAANSIDINLDRGTCWHQVHVDYKAERFGVTPVSADEAVLTKYRSADGG